MDKVIEILNIFELLNRYWEWTTAKVRTLMIRRRRKVWSIISFYSWEFSVEIVNSFFDFLSAVSDETYLDTM